MDRGSFTKSAPGRLVPTGYGAFAFVPNTIPPKLDLGVLSNEVEQAGLAVGELKGIGRAMQDSQILVGPLVSREAVYSSRIEGTIASATQLAMFEAELEQGRSESNVLEVGNYARALRYGIVRLEHLPVSQRLMRELHAILLTGVRGEERRSGEIRTQQNWIGQNQATPTADAGFVPPPVSQLADLLDNFERCANEHGPYPVVVNLAILHYQFETIHPFADGNGRIGRLLLSMLMHQWDLMDRPLLHLSPYFEDHYSDYVDLMLAVSQRGEWLPWIRFVLQAIKAQATDALGIAQYLLDLRSQYLARVQTPRSSALLPRVVDQLFVRPAINVPQAASMLGVSYMGAQQIIRKLTDAGILKEIRRPNGRKVFVAADIVAVSQGRLRPPTLPSGDSQTVVPV